MEEATKVRGREEERVKRRPHIKRIRLQGKSFVFVIPYILRTPEEEEEEEGNIRVTLKDCNCTLLLEVASVHE